MRFLLLFSVYLLPAVSQVPIGFEQNLGQFPPAVRFVRRSPDLIYITRDAIVLRNSVRIQIADVDLKVTPEGDSPSSTRYNFYQGSNSSAWRTDIRMFESVRLTNIYPGVSAVFTTSIRSLDAPLSFGQGKVILTIQPGADLRRFRLRVLNTGAIPFEGPGGIWFFGGRIPGVFNVTVLTAQIDGATRIGIHSTLKIESPDTLSVEAPGWNPALATVVEIAFPSSDVTLVSPPAVKSADGDRYLTSFMARPLDFGEDGRLDPPNCTCPDAVLARLDDTGRVIWVSLFGGQREDRIDFAAPSMNGVAVSGTTSSEDFPLTLNAPRSRLGSTRDIFFAFFDRDSGQLRTATYSGIEGEAWLQVQTVDSGRDLATGGGYLTQTSSLTDSLGYLLRWNPFENRFVFSLRFEAPVTSVAFDRSSNLYFAAMKPLSPSFITGVVDAGGRQQGSLVTVSASPAPGDARFTEIRLLPADGGDLWAVYQVHGTQVDQGAPPLRLARISPARNQVLVNRPITTAGSLADMALTPAGNLKLRVQSPAWTEATTPDAPLVAACPDSSYFIVVSPSGQIVYATYVPNTTFDFATQNEAQSPTPARLSCLANTAGRSPAVAAAPGELITITGGGFGPASPIYYAPDESGKYPLNAGRFRVRIGGLDAHIIAIARGLIAAQVPYEIEPDNVVASIEVFENGTPLNAIPFRAIDHSLGLFDTGDRNNALNLPALVALNQDGTVNSKDNPAAVGSIVSLYGGGLGRLSPALVSGGLSPIPPDGPLSQSSLLRACRGCEILYMGSAPGLSTSVIQINARIVTSELVDGVRAHGIGIVVSTSPRSLLVFSPTGVVFIK